MVTSRAPGNISKGLRLTVMIATAYGESRAGGFATPFVSCRFPFTTITFQVRRRRLQAVSEDARGPSPVLLTAPAQSSLPALSPPFPLPRDCPVSHRLGGEKGPARLVFHGAGDRAPHPRGWAPLISRCYSETTQGPKRLHVKSPSTVRTCVCTCVHMYVHVCARVHVCMCACVCRCASVTVGGCVHTCVYACVHL